MHSYIPPELENPPQLVSTLIIAFLLGKGYPKSILCPSQDQSSQPFGLID
jgi:hypothetical protein